MSSFTTGNAKLSGFITFRDAYEPFGQADAGSEIYIINENDVKSTIYSEIAQVVESFQLSKTFYADILYNTLDPKKIRTDREDFETYSVYASKYILGFRKLPAISRATTNGTGNFTVNLMPGKYYILVISHNVKENNIIESNGKIELRVMEINSAKEASMNVIFIKNDMVRVIPYIVRQSTGCYVYSKRMFYPGFFRQTYNHNCYPN